MADGGALSTAAALIAYLLLTWFLGSFLKLKSPDIWILRGGLALIGLAGAALFIWYRAKQDRQKKAADPGPAPAGGDELDALLNEAAAKLASARLLQGASFGALPVIFATWPTTFAAGLPPACAYSAWPVKASTNVESSGAPSGETSNWRLSPWK